jgi:hypothetical protein
MASANPADLAGGPRPLNELPRSLASGELTSRPAKGGFDSGSPLKSFFETGYFFASAACFS